jgi:hypothetical protein
MLVVNLLLPSIGWFIQVFIVCVVLCTVFRLIVLLFCVMCVVCVLCLIVVPLPPGETHLQLK